MASALINKLSEKNKYDELDPRLNRIMFLIDIFKEREEKYREVIKVRKNQERAFELSNSKRQNYSVVYTEHTVFGRTMKLCDSTEGDLEYKLIEFGRKISKIISDTPEMVQNEKVASFLYNMEFKSNEYKNKHQYDH
ncbi:hypothetical protein pEaSNUABM50_00528 [Erwinia phage pEa_SNUABM_50]|uniref:Uncharacterized protein n=1 Tax=Erwinia phage pEa_SNUABM_50 TaxID=2768775 RepID=A0A7L8ZQG7_9CAUD|nr:hypothetical protein pEaSNUABM50_00528 [Erwinia phage pEa_SNUABM_50]